MRFITAVTLGLFAVAPWIWAGCLLVIADRFGLGPANGIAIATACVLLIGGYFADGR